MKIAFDNHSKRVFTLTSFTPGPFNPKGNKALFDTKRLSIIFS